MLGGAKPEVRLRAGLSESQIRAQLEKILASETFGRSERLSHFLRYIVEESLRGNSHTLKEQVVAHDVYGRGGDFDPSADPIVRVDARRLRDKLREYYAGAGEESVVIGLPKGSYLPSFERKVATMPVLVQPLPASEPASRRFRWSIAVGASVAVVAAVAVWYAVWQPAPSSLRIGILTSLPGNELSPSLSPDGDFVVFGWINGGPADLYIKAISGDSLRRLTETTQQEFSPKWSPDGRSIAFSRAGAGVFITSALDGAERKVGESGSWVDWAADSKSVFVVDVCRGETNLCIHQIALDTLEKRQITKPDGSQSYYSFAASPDGRSLAVVRGGAISDVYLVPLDGGEPRRLTTQNRHMQGVAWAPDSKSVFYSVLEGTRFRLWRTAASGADGNGEPVTSPGENVRWPSIARGKVGTPVRLAYQTLIHDVSLRLVALNPTGPADPVGTAAPFADATEGRDCGAKFSPDASQIVFYSLRTGRGLLWVAGRDGSGLHPLTPMTAQEIRPGGWSPDGRQVVFEANSEGNPDIYVTNNAGANPLRLTSEPSHDGLPTWSPDGRWIYFTSDRSGSFQIWKMLPEGGTATQVTFGGGLQPKASDDGKYIYYVSGVPFGSRRPAVLKRIPATGGEESVVLQGVTPFNWSVTSNGIYNLALEQGGQFLERYDPVTRERTRLGVMPFPVALAQCGFMTVSQDARFLVANHVDRDESNLGLIDGLH